MLRQALLVVIVLLQVSVAAAVQVGGFDLGRGGPYSMSSGAYTAPLRTLLSGTFAGTTFSGSGTLTPAYLSTVDLLVITTAYSDSQGVVPLSPAEQSALVSFVQGGGRALILGERNDLGAATNQSLMNPFGLNIIGATFSDPTATVLNPLSVPFTAGPYGVVSTLSTTNPGWFDTVGVATTVALLDSNSQPLLAYFPENTLAAGSGRVIFSADSDIYTSNVPLILNSFVYLSVPEPSSVVLAMIGVCASGLMVLRQRRGSRTKWY